MFQSFEHGKHPWRMINTITIYYEVNQPKKRKKRNKKKTQECWITFAFVFQRRKTNVMLDEHEYYVLWAKPFINIVLTIRPIRAILIRQYLHHTHSWKGSEYDWNPYVIHRYIHRVYIARASVCVCVRERERERECVCGVERETLFCMCEETSWVCV